MLESARGSNEQTNGRTDGRTDEHWTHIHARTQTDRPTDASSGWNFVDGDVP